MKLNLTEVEQRLWDQTSWFVVQAKPSQETLAAAQIAKLQTEIFLPQRRSEELRDAFSRRWSKPLFPGYFFARFCPATSLDAVRYAHGVVRVVGTSRCPSPVEDAIVLGLQARVDADGLIPFEPPSLRIGDRVSVERGPFRGLIGKVLREWDDGKRVTILLEAIQQAQVLIERRSLVVVTQTA